MDKSKGIKAIIIVATLLAECFVWAYGFPEEPKAVQGGQEQQQEQSEETRKDESQQQSEETAPKQEDPAENASTAAKEPVAADTGAGYLILVNKQHYLNKDYKPEDLESIKYFAKDRSAEGRYMRAEAAAAFHKLSETAAEAGHEIVVTTAYRSYGFQSTLYNNYVKNEGQAAADRYSAKPGTSEHQTGLAADVSSPSVDYKLTQAYGDTAEGIWLAENAHLFGFIIRFPREGEEITGYMYEPWHIRYVGTEVAAQIYEKGITLEEYLGQ